MANANWRETRHGCLLNPETKQGTCTMAAAELPRDLPSATFMAGSYQFTRAQATQLARLHHDGVPVRRLLEEFYPDATVNK